MKQRFCKDCGRKVTKAVNYMQSYTGKGFYCYSCHKYKGDDDINVQEVMG